MATLPGAWCYRVSAGTGWPGVRASSLGDVGSLICNLYLGVAARNIEQICPCCALLGLAATKQQQQQQQQQKQIYCGACRANALALLSGFHQTHRLLGLVVKASASRAGDPGFESRLRRDFPGSSHTSDLKIRTPVATPPGAWRDRVSTGTGRPGVSIL